jgi:nucleotide-binding universal stress UspA family protein
MKAVIERILVTTDGSTESEHAFAAMMPVVRSDDPDVAVLHVVEQREDSFRPPERVVKACRALRENGVNARLEIRDGRPAEEIARLGNRMDLVVMATHGRSGFRRILVGSVTEAVLRRLEVPILVTRPGTAVRTWSPMAVALDGSPRSEQILEDVVPLARRLKASVELIQAVLPPITMSGLGDVGGVQIHEDPLPYLERVKTRLSSEGIDARVKALEGRAGSEILRYARDRGISLLCMTTHGRTGLLRALMGSITDEVIRHAPCPVLLRRSVPAESGSEFEPLPVKALPGLP